MAGNSSIWNALYRGKRARRTVKKQAYLKQFIKPEHRLFLELFTATGQNAKAVKQKNPRAYCIGIDFNFDLCREAKKNGFLTVVGDCRQLPFKKNSFDLIYVNSLHHVSHRAKEVLSQSVELLKPAGIFVGIEPYGRLCSLLAAIIYFLPDFMISLLPKAPRNYVTSIKYECRNEGVIDWYFGEYDIKEDISNYHLIDLNHDWLRVFYCIQKQEAFSSRGTAPGVPRKVEHKL